MRIDLVARAKEIIAPGRGYIHIYTQGLRDVETWLREWKTAIEKPRPTATQDQIDGGVAAIEAAADELKKILEEIDG